MTLRPSPPATSLPRPLAGVRVRPLLPELRRPRGSAGARSWLCSPGARVPGGDPTTWGVHVATAGPPAATPAPGGGASFPTRKPRPPRPSGPSGRPARPPGRPGHVGARGPASAAPRGPWAARVPFLLHRRPPLGSGASPLPPKTLSGLETDSGWVGKSGGRRGGLWREDGTAPDLEETPVRAWNVSPSAHLFLFRGPFFLVLLLYFFPFCSAICVF